MFFITNPSDGPIVINISGGLILNQIGTGEGWSYELAAGTTSTVTINNNITITLTPLLAGSVASVYLAGTSTLVDENTNTGTSWAFSVAASTAVDIVVLDATADTDDASIPIRFQSISFTVSQNFPINQVPALPYSG